MPWIIRIHVSGKKVDEDDYRFEKPGIITVGRSSNCDISLKLPEAAAVSRRHLQLEYRPDDSLGLTDLQSLNGTRVNNGPPVGSHQLSSGDLIRLGVTSIELQVHWEEEHDTEVGIAASPPASLPT